MDVTETFEADGQPRGPVLRDDEADFAALRDAALACRRAGVRLRLVDTGKLAASELEWIAQAGADLYTSDLARTSLAEIVFLSLASRKGGAATSYFHHGAFEPGRPEAALDAEAVREMAASGIFVALSDRARPRESDKLLSVAASARRGKSPLVYYHHRPLVPWLEDLGREGAWIHVVAPGKDEAADLQLLRRTAAAAAAAGQGLILHVERTLDAFAVEDLLDAGAFGVFERPPADFKSLVRPLENRAARRRPGARAGYLYREFMR